MPEPDFYKKYEQWRPGVYVQREFIPRDLPTFLTGVPAFIGTAIGTNAPVNTPVRIELWSQFRTHFDGPPCLLSYAVRGFFENGGDVCYVVPTAARKMECYEEALETIAELESVDLVSVPEYPEGKEGEPDIAALLQLQGMMTEHCRRLGDRLALLDPAPNESWEDLAKRRSGLAGRAWAALYYPWLKVHGVSRPLEDVPPSPYVAGLYARVDRVSGVGKAPANELVEGVADVASELELEAQGSLSEAGVNFIQPLRGRGFRVWGARTLSGPAEEKGGQVNVKRVMITVIRWIRENMRDVPFERNGPRLWARIDREITSYLMSLFRSGALQGATPAGAFDVSTTGGGEGEAVTTLRVAPVIPFEFIVVRLIHGETGVVLSAPEQS